MDEDEDDSEDEDEDEDEDVDADADADAVADADADMGKDAQGAQCASRQLLLRQSHIWPRTCWWPPTFQ